MTEYRDCEFTDGYIDLKDEECQRCTSSARNLCKIFSVRKGFRSMEYFFEMDSPEIDKKNVNFLKKLKELR